MTPRTIAVVVLVVIVLMILIVMFSSAGAENKEHVRLVQYGRDRNSGSPDGTYIVKFKTPFSTIPSVVISAERGVKDYFFTPQLLSVAKDGFTYRLLFATVLVPAGVYIAGDGHTVNWVASEVA